MFLLTSTRNGARPLPEEDDGNEDDEDGPDDDDGAEEVPASDEDGAAEEDDDGTAGEDDAVPAEEAAKDEEPGADEADTGPEDGVAEEEAGAALLAVVDDEESAATSDVAEEVAMPEDVPAEAELDGAGRDVAPVDDDEPVDPPSDVAWAGRQVPSTHSSSPVHSRELLQGRTHCPSWSCSFWPHRLHPVVQAATPTTSGRNTARSTLRGRMRFLPMMATTRSMAAGWWAGKEEVARVTTAPFTWR